GIGLKLGHKYDRFAIGRQAALQEVGLVVKTNTEILQRGPSGSRAVPEGESVVDVKEEAVVIGTGRNEVVGSGCVNRLTEIYALRPGHAVRCVRFPNVFAVLDTTNISG